MAEIPQSDDNTGNPDARASEDEKVRRIVEATRYQLRCAVVMSLAFGIKNLDDMRSLRDDLVSSGFDVEGERLRNMAGIQAQEMLQSLTLLSAEIFSLSSEVAPDEPVLIAEGVTPDEVGQIDLSDEFGLAVRSEHPKAGFGYGGVSVTLGELRKFVYREKADIETLAAQDPELDEIWTSTKNAGREHTSAIDIFAEVQS